MELAPAGPASAPSSTASVVAAWKDDGNAYLAVSVVEQIPSPSGPTTKVEYIGSVPLAALVGLTDPQIKAALVVAVQAERARSFAAFQPTNNPLPISGTIPV
jgi:hypothetical protein